MKKKKIIIVLIIILFIAFVVYTRLHPSSESTSSEAARSEDAEVTSASSSSSESDTSYEGEPSSESSEDDVVESMKRATEMNSLYGAYLSENPVDFFSGEVEITVTSLEDAPVMTIDVDENGVRYFCLTVGEKSYEEYISGDTAYICIQDESGESWIVKSLTANDEESDAGLAEITNLFEQVIEAMNLGSVYELLESAPELQYQKTLTIGEITELDVFASVISSGTGLINGSLPEDEYEEYIQALEEEAERMKELLEENEDILFEIDDEEVGYCYLYIDSSNDSLRFINTVFGEDSSANFIFRDNETNYAESIPDSAGDYNEQETSTFFETLLNACA